MTEGGIAPAEMARTFNCGIGMVAIVRAADTAEAIRILTDAGENVCDIGEIVAGNELSGNDGERVTLPGLDAAWPV